MQLVARVKFLTVFARNGRLTAKRPLTQFKPALKWVSGVKAGAEFPVGSCHGHPDDPERNTRTIDVTHIEGKEEPIPEFMYRELPSRQSFLDRQMHRLCASIFFAWFFYNSYWNSGLILGHHSLPYLYEFTDEELGIPPDSAEDPEYWGHHGKPYNTYR